MLDITLALIFSQLPHPECWMPRLPLEALNCFWLALPAWFLVLAWFLCLCGGSLCPDAVVFVCVCVLLTSHSRGSSDTCVILWSFNCLYKITTVLNMLYSSSPPFMAQTVQYSAHRLILIQIQCVRKRQLDISAPFFFSSTFILWQLASAAMPSHFLYFFQPYHHRFQSLSPAGWILWRQQ